MASFSQGWTLSNAFDTLQGAQFPPSYPNELLVKICSSRKYSQLTESLFGHTIDVLEVGCFSGNNMRMFIEKGWRVSGTEINAEIAHMGHENLRRLGYSPPEVRIGSNLDQPWESSAFDLLVSINTLHYSTGGDVVRSLLEFSRVLRSAGVAIVETVGPEHFALLNSTRRGPLDWTWHAGGFREGESFGFFDDERHFAEVLGTVFSQVEVNVRTEVGPNTQLQFLTAICSGGA